MSEEAASWGWLQIVKSVVPKKKVCVWFVVVPCRKREASDQQA